MYPSSAVSAYRSLVLSARVVRQEHLDVHCQAPIPFESLLVRYSFLRERPGVTQLLTTPDNPCSHDNCFVEYCLARRDSQHY